MFVCVREEFHGSAADFEKYLYKSWKITVKFANLHITWCQQFPRLATWFKTIHLFASCFVLYWWGSVLVRYSSVINKSWDTFRISHRDNWLKRILGVQCNIRNSQGRCVVIESDKQTNTWIKFPNAVSIIRFTILCHLVYTLTGKWFYALWFFYNDWISNHSNTVLPKLMWLPNLSDIILRGDSLLNFVDQYHPASMIPPHDRARIHGELLLLYSYMNAIDIKLLYIKSYKNFTDRQLVHLSSILRLVTMNN